VKEPRKEKYGYIYYKEGKIKNYSDFPQTKEIYKKD
jgi:hypothetical protein